MSTEEDGKEVPESTKSPNNEGKDVEENCVTESGATIVFEGPSNAFYNPAQEFNRDLSIAVARYVVAARAEEATALEAQLAAVPEGTEGLGKKKRTLEDRRAPLRVLEALAASGLRAIRYAQELDGLAPIVANDFSTSAVGLMRANVQRNNVEGKVLPNYADAITLMHAHKVTEKRFHVVDLDPYGSPAQFLDAAVQAVAEDGVLMVTCTDVAVLCGNSPESCFAKYGCMPARSKACHEVALRIVLKAIESHANRYARYITPLLSISVDFYIRVFVRLNTSQKLVKDSVCKLAWLEQCVSCGTQRWQPLAKKTETAEGKGAKFAPAQLEHDSALCEQCKSRFQVCGPFWSDPLHDAAFVAGLLGNLKALAEERRPATYSRILGMLSIVQEELPEVPLFYDYAELMRIGKCTVPKLATFRSALLNAGFRVSISHTEARAIKTNAPANFLWDIVRSFVAPFQLSAEWKIQLIKAKSYGVVANKFPPESATHQILAKEIINKIDFTTHPEAESKSRLEGLLRFQDNRGKNHGPTNKAKGSIHSVQAGAYGGGEPEKKRVKVQVSEEEVKVSGPWRETRTNYI